MTDAVKLNLALVSQVVVLVVMAISATLFIINEDRKLEDGVRALIDDKVEESRGRVEAWLAIRRKELLEQMASSRTEILEALRRSEEALVSGRREAFVAFNQSLDLAENRLSTRMDQVEQALREMAFLSGLEAGKRGVAADKP